jgi:hypothetical protein
MRPRAPRRDPVDGLGGPAIGLGMASRTATTQAIRAQRLMALALVYVLALQALMAAGGQIRAILAATPGLCTILGYEEPSGSQHTLAHDGCIAHCASAAADWGNVAASLALSLTALVFAPACGMGSAGARKTRRAFDSRGPPA